MDVLENKPDVIEQEKPISGRKLAELCGVTETSIRKARDNGRIQSYDAESKKYFMPAAKLEFETYRDPAKVRDVPELLEDMPADDFASSDTEIKKPEFLKDKERFERARADKMEMEARRMRGELVDKAAVEKDARLVAQRVKRALTGAVERLAPELAMEIEPAKCKEILDKAFRDILEGLSNGR